MSSSDQTTIFFNLKAFNKLTSPFHHFFHHYFSVLRRWNNNNLLLVQKKNSSNKMFSLFWAVGKNIPNSTEKKMVKTGFVVWSDELIIQPKSEHYLSLKMPWIAISPTKFETFLRPCEMDKKLTYIRAHTWKSLYRQKAYVFVPTT